MRGSANVPLFPGQTLDASVVGKQLDLAFLSALTPAIRESAGKVEVNLRATGSLGRPVVVGYVVLEGGKLQPSGVSLLHGLSARLDLEPDRIRLSRLAVQGDRGKLDISGQVVLGGRGLELARGAGMMRSAELLARAKGFGVDAGGMTEVAFSGRVRVDARQDNRTIAVNVAVEDGVVKMPKLARQHQTHATSLPPDVVFVDGPRAAAGRGKKAAPPSRLGLRLDLRADPLFLRGEELDLELANRLLIRTDSKGRPRISGSVQIRRGRLRVLKNTLEVRQATVRFSGEVDPDPALDILLERTAPEALVLIQLSGTVKAPELSLRSDPPVYDQGQILSLLLTGRVDSRSDAGGADPSMAIAGAISQALLGNVLQKVAPKMGIDVARVNLDQTKDQKTGESQLRAEAEVGKYLTERLYTGYRRVFGASAQENTNEGLLEYRISGGWLLTALFGDAGVGGLDLLWNYRH